MGDVLDDTHPRVHLLALAPECCSEVLDLQLDERREDDEPARDREEVIAEVSRHPVWDSVRIGHTPSRNSFSTPKASAFTRAATRGSERRAGLPRSPNLPDGQPRPTIVLVTRGRLGHRRQWGPRVKILGGQNVGRDALGVSGCIGGCGQNVGITRPDVGGRPATVGDAGGRLTCEDGASISFHDCSPVRADVPCSRGS